MFAFAALSDPTRRAILEMVARQGATPASTISAQVPMTPSAISQHLKALVEAGLLSREVRGQQRRYRLAPEGFDELEKWLERTRWFAAQSGKA